MQRRNNPINNGRKHLELKSHETLNIKDKQRTLPAYQYCGNKGFLSPSGMMGSWKQTLFGDSRGLTMSLPDTEFGSHARKSQCLCLMLHMETLSMETIEVLVLVNLLCYSVSLHPIPTLGSFPSIVQPKYGGDQLFNTICTNFFDKIKSLKEKIFIDEVMHDCYKKPLPLFMKYT